MRKLKEEKYTSRTFRSSCDIKSLSVLLVIRTNALCSAVAGVNIKILSQNCFSFILFSLPSSFPSPHFSTQLIQRLKASGMIMLSVGIWFQIGLHRYMELSTYYTNSFQILLVTVGLIIIFIASIACCCTLKAESSILYLVRE